MAITTFSLRLRFFICIVLIHAVLFISCATAQEPGFLSIDCGSNSTSTYTDDNEIQWVSDVNQISEGVAVPLSGITDFMLSSMRLFNGNLTKYCYSLTNDAVQAGAFFLLRAVFWAGISPPYLPQNSDGYFRFKLIVDADEWYDVKLPYGTTTYYSYEVYMRAQRSTIDVCLARITSTGDAPFISGLELRPLPSTLTSTILMNGTSRIFIPLGHSDYGVPSTGPSVTRYPLDSLDRLWLSSKALDSELYATDAVINVANNIDKPPARILQNSFTTAPNISSTFTGYDSSTNYVVEFYFAEINPAVNASGQRAFNILANGELQNTNKPIDVFAEVGADAAYSYATVVTPTAAGEITFDFNPTATSIFPPFIAAAEIFQHKKYTPVTSATIVSTIEDIKTSLGLSRYTGDPCLPVRFGYSWLNCSGDSGITQLLLSNYNTGGEIATAFNSLTSLTELRLDGNALQGQIPDLSALTSLEILDLSNNQLSGSIPTYFETYKNLKELYLQNNNLSGPIPDALLLRQNASLLTFDFSGNPLCATSNGVCTSPPTAQPVLPTEPKKKSNTGVIIGAVVAAILVVIIVIGILVYCFCLKPSNTKEERVDKDQGTPMMQELPLVIETPSPVINKVIPKVSVQEFSFRQIINATDNFKVKLGQGGFGPVYQGCLQDGRSVAIKVSSNSSHQGSKEFLNEVDLLSRVHHKNLVGLLGYCNEEKLVLVYEYMSNGSLFDCLHGPYARASPLSWAARLQIAVDAAQGLDYMHNGCDPRIIHRDIKSSNILLNDKMEAKLSDFGISRDYMRNETGAPPTALMGSMGYMDPEYLSSMKLTEKVDVYSFGVVLFEAICGRMAVFQDSASQEPVNLVEWAKASVNRGVIDDIVDESLHGQYDVQSVWKVVEVALACVEFSSAKRPKMNDVYLELREAERMEHESEERSVIDKPSIEFNGGDNYNTMSYTHVSAR